MGAVSAGCATLADRVGPRRRVLVIGGGPAGLAAALALRARGIEPLVFDQVERPGRAGTGLTLWPNALAALATFGAEQPIREAGLASEGNEIRTPSGTLLDAIAGAEMRERFGGTGIALHRADLVGRLLEPLGAGVVRTCARCVGYRDEGWRVVAAFADGVEVAGDALVGADGIRSLVRSQLMGGSDALRYCGYAVWRGVTDFPLAPAPGLLTMGAGAQFGLFPMRNDRAYWFASLAMEAGRARTLPARRLLLERFGSWHPPIGDVLEATADAQILVTDIYDRRPLRRWGRGRVTLAGDAAHPSAPTLGQGTCQAFEDAAVLAHRLGSHDDVVSALRDYESSRRSRANGLTVQARRLGTRGKVRRPAGVWLREQAMRRAPREPRMRQMERMFAFSTGEAT
jgi:2-polyprenyl-6-methoxyphenol hydroxylase-like FAD-dependent oxidoreductase